MLFGFSLIQTEICRSVGLFSPAIGLRFNYYWKVCSGRLYYSNGHIWQWVQSMHWEIAFLPHFSTTSKRSISEIEFCSFVRSEYMQNFQAIVGCCVALLDTGLVNLSVLWHNLKMHIQADGRQLYQNPGSPIDVKECSQSNS